MDKYTAEIIEDILTVTWRVIIIIFPMVMVFTFHQSPDWFWVLILLLIGSSFRLSEQKSKED